MGPEHHGHDSVNVDSRLHDCRHISMDIRLELVDGNGYLHLVLQQRLAPLAQELKLSKYSQDIRNCQQAHVGKAARRADVPHAAPVDENPILNQPDDQPGDPNDGTERHKREH